MISMAYNRLVRILQQRLQHAILYNDKLKFHVAFVSINLSAIKNYDVTSKSIKKWDKLSVFAILPGGGVSETSF